MANTNADTMEVVMLTQISGPLYQETGRTEDGRSVMSSKDWPPVGGKIILPRSIAMDLIHNELAYPASMKRRPKDRSEAFIAAGIGA